LASSARRLVLVGLIAGAALALLAPAKAKDQLVADVASPASGPASVFAPAGPPTGVAILLSGDTGLDAEARTLAGKLSGWGVLVVGVDTRAFSAATAPDPGPCCSLGTRLLALVDRAGGGTFPPPILVGYGSGASRAVAAAAESGPRDFAALITIDYCPPRQAAGKVLIPWVDLHASANRACTAQALAGSFAGLPSAKAVLLPGTGTRSAQEDQWVPQFRDAYLKLATAAAATTNAPPLLAGDVSDLPLTEVTAKAGRSRRLAILLTGDGGFAGLDRDMSTRLAAAGVPVVALSTLQYFWTERSPDDAARDLARITAHYLAAWNKDQVILIGYSFGANVLPFIVAKLPAAARKRLVSVDLLAPATHASFEIHVADWVPGSVPEGRPLEPVLPGLGGLRVLCLYGAEERDSLCPRFPPGTARIIKLHGGHHFDDDSATLVRHILDFAGH
jgi:type IV secretory pathway VirJ component